MLIIVSLAGQNPAGHAIFTYQNPWCVQVILDASENIYVYIFTVYTHTYICIKVYIHLCIYTVYIYTHRYMLKVDFIFF